MRKTVVAALVGLAFGANAASMDDINISGFGSVGVGKSDNDIGYAGYTDDKVDWEQETLAGLQFDFQINDKAKFVSQFVADSHYDYELKVAMAYASYDFDNFTARAGKLRLPLFLYSDYFDLGYGYPMIRPSQELYTNLVLKGYTGADLLIPIEFDNSSLLIQPVVGIAEIDEDDSAAGEVKLNKTFGISANWNYDDFTLRGSYFVAEAAPEDDNSAYYNDLDGKDGTFISIGAQYDNGDLLVNLEAADVELDGKYSDYQSVSGLVGYRVSSFTPYIGVSWVETQDDSERPKPQITSDLTDMTDPVTRKYMYDSGLHHVLNYERISYSLGSRWDFARNMALTFDVTYADYKDTSGGFSSNVSDIGTYNEDDSFVYSAKLDFVF